MYCLLTFSQLKTEPVESVKNNSHCFYQPANEKIYVLENQGHGGLDFGRFFFYIFKPWICSCNINTSPGDVLMSIQIKT